MKHLCYCLKERMLQWFVNKTGFEAIPFVSFHFSLLICVFVKLLHWLVGCQCVGGWGGCGREAVGECVWRGHEGCGREAVGEYVGGRLGGVWAWGMWEGGCGGVCVEGGSGREAEGSVWGGGCGREAVGEGGGGGGNV